MPGVGIRVLVVVASNQNRWLLLQGYWAVSLAERLNTT